MSAEQKWKLRDNARIEDAGGKTYSGHISAIDKQTGRLTLEVLGFGVIKNIDPNDPELKRGEA